MVVYRCCLLIYSKNRSERPAEKEAKEVHKSLKVAGGQFKFVQEVLNSKLIKSSQVQPFFDITDNIMTAYVNQCKAEAQESWSSISTHFRLKIDIYADI